MLDFLKTTGTMGGRRLEQADPSAATWHEGALNSGRVTATTPLGTMPFLSGSELREETRRLIEEQAQARRRR